MTFLENIPRAKEESRAGAKKTQKINYGLETACTILPRPCKISIDTVIYMCDLFVA